MVELVDTYALGAYADNACRFKSCPGHHYAEIADMDRIVVLENGKIVEQGKHSDLIKSAGAYGKLWSRQSGAFLSEK